VKVKKYNKVNTCRLCGEKDFSEIGTSRCPILEPKCKLVKCNNCGFVFLNPTPDENEVGKIYSFVYRHGANGILAKLLNYYIAFDINSDAKLIRKYLKSGKVLDVGYGSGEMLNSLKGNWEKHGYDPYSKKKDRKLIKHKFGIFTYTKEADIKNNCFDLVILRNVIEHTVDFEKLLKLARKKLKDDGLVFIRTPNINSLDFKLFRNNWYMTYMGGHIVFFNKDTLQKIALKHKFKKLYLKSTTTSPPMSLARNLKTRFKIKTGFFVILIFPVSIIYSVFSGLSSNGNDLVAVYKKS
jgi:2-polyprenyl-3-methyl-5-hydroxy-6-metoxy-1,4-benzoquinol methylase